KARLQAEAGGASQVAFPPELNQRNGETAVAAAIASQEAEFVNRRTALAGQKQIIAQRGTQLQGEIVGSEAQKNAYVEQLDSVSAERTSLQPLLQKGIITSDRLLELDRTVSGIQGQAGQTKADIARAKAAIEENQAQSDQLDKDRAAEISN